MPQYVALLRGINLGRRRPKMEQLAALFEGLDFSHVSTYIASGNVLFFSPKRAESALEQEIESHLKDQLGYPVDTFLRTADELGKVAAEKPFGPVTLESGASTIQVSFFKEPLAAALARALNEIETPVDRLQIRGRELYWHCKVRTSESKLWTSPQVRALRLPSSTMRNLTTVQKLAALALKI